MNGPQSKGLLRRRLVVNFACLQPTIRRVTVGHPTGDSRPSDGLQPATQSKNSRLSDGKPTGYRPPQGHHKATAKRPDDLQRGLGVAEFFDALFVGLVAEVGEG